MGGHLSMYTHYNFTLPKENLALLNNNFGLEMGQQAQKQEKESLFQNLSTEMKRKVNLQKPVTLQTVKAISGKSMK